MKLIYLIGGKVAKVDDSDFDYLSQFTWHVARGYATRSEGASVKIRMHREIIGAVKGQEVDHADGDRLNNSRSNLRFCEHHQNMRNLPKRHWKQYKGVCLNGNWWKAKIAWTGGNKFNLGTYTTEEAAARAYDRKAHQLDPEFCRLNFDDGIWTEAQLAEFRVVRRVSSTGTQGVYPHGSRFVARVPGPERDWITVGKFHSIEEASAAREAYLAAEQLK